MHSMPFNRADLIEGPYTPEFNSSTSHFHCPLKVTMPPYLHHLISVQGKEINMVIKLRWKIYHLFFVKENDSGSKELIENLGRPIAQNN